MPWHQRLACLALIGVPLTLLGAVASRHLDPLPPGLSMPAQYLLATIWSLAITAAVWLLGWSIATLNSRFCSPRDGASGYAASRHAAGGGHSIVAVSALMLFFVGLWAVWPGEHQRRLASDWHATAGDLRQLANDALARSRPEVLVAVVTHRNTPLDVVETLAHSDRQVLDQKRWSLMALLTGPGSPWTVRRLAADRLAFERARSAVDRDAGDAHLAGDVVAHGDGDLLRTGL